jgi:hypothetical protein
MKKFQHYFFYALLAWLLILAQLNLVNTLPFGWNKLNLILLVLILLLFFLNYKTTLLIMLIGGFLLDVYSFNFFGIYMLTVFLTVVASDFLLTNFFTNRSTYSFLALTGLVTLFYNFCLYFLIYLTKFLEEQTFFLFSGNFWLGLAMELGWSLAAVFVFFLIMNLTTNRLRPVFLDKK